MKSSIQYTVYWRVLQIFCKRKLKSRAVCSWDFCRTSQNKANLTYMMNSCILRTGPPPQCLCLSQLENQSTSHYWCGQSIPTLTGSCFQLDILYSVWKHFYDAYDLFRSQQTSHTLFTHNNLIMRPVAWSALKILIMDEKSSPIMLNALWFSA